METGGQTPLGKRLSHFIFPLLAEQDEDVFVEPPTTESTCKFKLWSCTAKWWMLIPVMVFQQGGSLLVSPSLPMMKTHFFGGSSDQAASVQGVVDSASAVLNVFVSAALGKASDVFGRRPVILLSICCTMWPILCLVVVPKNLWYFFVASVFSKGLGGQQTNATQAYVADCSPADMRVRNMGLLSALVAVTMVGMPTLASYLYFWIGETQAFVFALMFELVAILFLLIIPESSSMEHMPTMPMKLSFSDMVAVPLAKVLQDQGSLLRELAVVRFIEGLATNGLLTIMMFTMTEVVGFTAADMGFLLSLIGLWSVVVQGVLLPLLVKLGVSEHRMLLLAQSVRVICYGTYSMLGVFPFKWLIYVLESLEILTTVWEPAFASLLTKGNEQDKGFALGIFSAIDSMTRIVSPLIMSAFFQISPTVPWLVASIFSVGTLILVVRLPEPDAARESGINVERRRNG